MAKIYIVFVFEFMQFFLEKWNDHRPKTSNFKIKFWAKIGIMAKKSKIWPTKNQIFGQQILGQNRMYAQN